MHLTVGLLYADSNWVFYHCCLCTVYPHCISNVASSMLLAQVILWSQIKLISYDSSDVHITGEFENRPGDF